MRDKGTGGGQPPNTAGGNTTRGKTAHRGTPPANTTRQLLNVHPPRQRAVPAAAPPSAARLSVNLRVVNP